MVYMYMHIMESVQHTVEGHTTKWATLCVVLLCSEKAQRGEGSGKLVKGALLRQTDPP